MLESYNRNILFISNQLLGLKEGKEWKISVLFILFMWWYSVVFRLVFGKTLIFCWLEWQNTPITSLQSGKTSPLNKSPGHDTKQSDGEAPVVLELWEMQNTPSLPSFLGPLCPRVVAPDRALSMDQIELNCVLMLNWITWNRTVLILKLHTYVKLNCL